MAKVEVDEELKDILPGFMNNREKDLVLLREALANNDFETIGKIGHKVAGSSGGYGFDELGKMAKSLELKVKDGDTSNLKEIVDQFEEYIRNVEIVFV